MTRPKTLISALVFLLLPLSASADDGGRAFQYTAAFVCGQDPQPAFVRVVPGFYATSVAIHNAGARRADVTTQVALTFPPGARAPGPVSQKLVNTLEAGQAFQVDCEEIFGEPGTTQPGGVPTFSQYFPEQAPGVMFPPYIEGFVIVESRRRLNVTGVYTAAEGTVGQNLLVRSMHTEVIPERRTSRRGDDDDD